MFAGSPGEEVPSERPSVHDVSDAAGAAVRSTGAGQGVQRRADRHQLRYPSLRR